MAGIHGRSPLLRLQSDERLIGLVRRGNHGAFETLVGRYQSRLLSFCRHMLGSREDAEDVLQEVFAAAFNAVLADERPINVRPWLYRIARNRSLNHLRRVQPIGVDSMDVHYSEHGMTTADKVHRREDFRLLMGDVHGLPETQRTALLLREIDALSYDQIADAMETTVPSVKSLLVRARVSLAERAEARQLSCDEVRLELGEVAEGLKKLTPPVRRHLHICDRCTAFRGQLKQTNKALAAVLPVAPLLVMKKMILAHLGLSASAGSKAAGTGAAGSAAAGSAAGSSTGGLLTAGAGALAGKAAAGLAAAALVTAGAVEVDHVVAPSSHHTASKPTTLAVTRAPSRRHAYASPTTPRPLATHPSAAAHTAPSADATKRPAAKPAVSKRASSAVPVAHPTPATPPVAAPAPAPTTAVAPAPVASPAPAPAPQGGTDAETTTMTPASAPSGQGSASPTPVAPSGSGNPPPSSSGQAAPPSGASGSASGSGSGASGSGSGAGG